MGTIKKDMTAIPTLLIQQAFTPMDKNADCFQQNSCKSLTFVKQGMSHNIIHRNEGLFLQKLSKTLQPEADIRISAQLLLCNC